MKAKGGLKLYSQNLEEKIIGDYFGKSHGFFLDIGAFDGCNLSNTRRLMERGWQGVCIEPSPMVFPKLVSNLKQFPEVACLQFAIGNHTGRQKFYDNRNAVASLVPEHVNIWKKDQDFEPTEVDVMTFEDFVRKTWPIGQVRFGFISIDVEGLDYEVLKQIDFGLYETQMVCVENNGKDEQKYVDLVERQGLELVHKNSENLIFQNGEYPEDDIYGGI